VIGFGPGYVAARNLRSIRLSSRTEPFESAWIAEHLHIENAVLDCEIASTALDAQSFVTCCSAGASASSSRLSCCTSMVKDLRTLPLIERKAMLKKLLRRKRSRILYLDHVEHDGRLLFEQIVKMDLEGIVCKRKDSPYKVTEKPSRYWIKVKNSRYSQLEGREELFERT